MGMAFPGTIQHVGARIFIRWQSRIGILYASLLGGGHVAARLHELEVCHLAGKPAFSSLPATGRRAAPVALARRVQCLGVAPPASA